MNYGRTNEGKTWHMLHKGKPLCFLRSTIVETRDGDTVDHEEVCRNCDEALREKGKEARRAQPKKRSAKTDYTPRFKFEE